MTLKMSACIKYNILSLHIDNSTFSSTHTHTHIYIVIVMRNTNKILS